MPWGGFFPGDVLNTTPQFSVLIALPLTFFLNLGYTKLPLGNRHLVPVASDFQDSGLVWLGPQGLLGRCCSVILCMAYERT